MTFSYLNKIEKISGSKTSLERNPGWGSTVADMSIFVSGWAIIVCPEDSGNKGFRRNLSNKIKAKNKRIFYFKNKFWGFFFFAFNTLLDITILYTDTQHLKKEPIPYGHFKRTLFCNEPVGREEVRGPTAPSWLLSDYREIRQHLHLVALSRASDFNLLGQLLKLPLGNQ